ncbi:MAG: penicillin-binding protein activator [Gammaproteobacteria bacterium]|nr:penicillin-binding protein activator [Gammaproteobacteria bacterium]
MILTLAACESTSPETTVEAAPPAEDPARAALERAEAASTRAERARLYLAALTATYGQGDFVEASDIAALLEPLVADLGKTEQFRFGEIALELELSERPGHPPDDVRAAALLAQLRPFAPQETLVVARFRARLLTRRADNPRAAALAWIEVAAHDAAEDQDVRMATAAAWRQVSRLTILETDDLARGAPTDVGRAFAVLARDFNAALTDVLQFHVWEDWKKSHPGHPAARFAPPGAPPVTGKPRALALLIPLSGPLGGVGQAVRDGFSAALLHAEAATQVAGGGNPATSVRLYDTSSMAPTDAYRLAVSEGADLVIGPLQKFAVAEVAAVPPSVPVLALNHLDEAPRALAAQIPQFALAPEDDASAIAAALTGDGMERIVLFDTSASWSARAKARLLAERRGVEVVATGRLGSGDVTPVVGDALAVTRSTQRYAEIASMLTIDDLQFTPRRRDDVDAVVALVGEQQLLFLKRALEFHFAGALPIYAPSAAVGAALRPIDGVHVCGIPWRLHPDGLRAAAAPLPASRGSSAPWFAFGVDGFRLANQWQRLISRDAPIPGSTGTLRLAPNGRINRDLAWATVQGGRLVPRITGRE